MLTASNVRNNSYRLAVIEIAIPPLKHRTDDILPLAEHFLARAAAHAGKPIAGFSGAAVKRLLAHDWPGNVRELENAIERAAALCDGARISPDDLPEGVRACGRTRTSERRSASSRPQAYRPACSAMRRAASGRRCASSSTCAASEGAMSGRVAPGRRLPGAPTDPDVQVSRIRLFETRLRYTIRTAVGFRSG
ncbi:hypothetical protein [Sorangium sp. So ce388]|uniref:hypothetical protein n=1 Tax=Sorangium sp. So ce388 TaxID=3133309 RepID=UPI003F5AFA48